MFQVVRAEGDPDQSTTQYDYDANGEPDACDLVEGTSGDCNHNAVPDECDISGGTSADCQPNGAPDECEVVFPHDCCATGHGPACNDEAIAACVCAADRYCCLVEWDEVCVTEVDSFECGTCDLTSVDCNTNGVPDECDVGTSASLDCNSTVVPDECEAVGGGDFDADGHVGWVDYAGFADCLAGAEAAPQPASAECAGMCLDAFDFDDDGDVDLADFGGLQAAFTGP